MISPRDVEVRSQNGSSVASPANENRILVGAPTISAHIFYLHQPLPLMETPITGRVGTSQQWPIDKLLVTSPVRGALLRSGRTRGTSGTFLLWSGRRREIRSDSGSYESGRSVTTGNGGTARRSPKHLLGILIWKVFSQDGQRQDIGLDLFLQIGDLRPELACHGQADQSLQLTNLEPDRALANAARYPIEAIRTASACLAKHFRSGLYFPRTKVHALGRSVFGAFYCGCNKRGHGLFSLVIIQYTTIRR